MEGTSTLADQDPFRWTTKAKHEETTDEDGAVEQQGWERGIKAAARGVVNRPPPHTHTHPHV